MNRMSIFKARQICGGSFSLVKKSASAVRIEHGLNAADGTFTIYEFDLDADGNSDIKIRELQIDGRTIKIDGTVV